MDKIKGEDNFVIDSETRVITNTNDKEYERAKKRLKSQSDFITLQERVTDIENKMDDIHSLLKLINTKLE